MRLPDVQHKGGESEDATRSKPRVAGRILFVAGVLRRGEQMFDRVTEPHVPRLRERAIAMRLPGVQHKGGESEDATRSKPRVAGRIPLVAGVL